MSYKIKDLKIDQLFISKKKHPCGSYRWKIVRKGADFKIECLGCNRIVLIDAKKLIKIIKEVV